MFSNFELTTNNTTTTTTTTPILSSPSIFKQTHSIACSNSSSTTCICAGAGAGSTLTSLTQRPTIRPRLLLRNLYLSREEELARCQEQLANFTIQYNELIESNPEFSRESRHELIPMVSSPGSKYSIFCACENAIDDLKERIRTLRGDSLTSSGRVTSQPKRFQDEQFVPGSNNAYTKKRKTDGWDRKYHG